MSTIDWSKLAEPFPASEVKQRPGAATWDHRDQCQKSQCRETRDPTKHHQFDYVDARLVAQRLDDVLTPRGWSFTWTHIPGEAIVHGHLEIDGIVREDAGYPNSDRDEEPLKAAVSDALKRCAVLFGIGRHLYEDNKTPAAKRQPRKAGPTSDHDAGGLVGKATVGSGKADFELRQEPDGWAISFALVQGRTRIKVIAHGKLAEALAMLKPTVVDQTVTCWGPISEESFNKTEGGKVKTIRYRVLTLDRIQTPDGTLPAEEQTSAAA